MSTHSVPALRATRNRRSSPSWAESRPLWAGLAIIVMWLAVLFVGVFGGDIVSQTPGGTSSSIPVVVVIAGVALAGTLVVGRRAFTVTSPSDDVRRALQDEQQARPEIAEQVGDLRGDATEPGFEEPPAR